MKINDFLWGILSCFIGLFLSSLVMINISDDKATRDEFGFIFVSTYLLIIPMVVCTRVILRAVKGTLKCDKIEQKIKGFF